MTEPLFLKLVEDMQTTRRELGDLRRRIEIPTIAGGGSGAPSPHAHSSSHHYSLLAIADLAAGTVAGQFIRAGASPFTAVWSALTLPNAATTGDLLYASSANAIGNLADVAAGLPLLSGGIGVAPAYGALPVAGIAAGTAQNQVLQTGAGPGFAPGWSGWYLAGIAGQTYTFPAVGGGVTLGAGTLTVATANDATIANHTHAVTSSSNPGAVAAILASNASGYLQLTGLGLGIAPSTTRELYIYRVYDGSATQYGQHNLIYFTPLVDRSAAAGYAMAVSCGKTGNQNYGYMTSVACTVSNIATGGTLSSAVGFLTSYVLTGATGGGNTVLFEGFRVNSPSRDAGSVATIGTSYALSIYNQGAAYITTSAAIYLAAQSGSGTNYSIYAAGGASYHAGGFAFGGTVAAAAQVHIDQSSATGAVPVLLLDQADEDKPYTKYVGATAADWTKPISTLQGGGAATGPLRSAGGGGQTGWLFAGMARMDINGATVWMPYYTEETT